jgi:hypothetical protein
MIYYLTILAILFATTGNVFPTVGESNNGIGATAWTTPTNIVSDNGSDATCNAAASSQYLVGRTVNIVLPANARVLGVTVNIEASEHSGGTESLFVQLQNSGGSLIGNSKSQTLSGTTKAVYTYGGAADTWGATITKQTVESSTFGVRAWFTTAHDVRIDYMTIAVEYSTYNKKGQLVTFIQI